MPTKTSTKQEEQNLQTTQITTPQKTNITTTDEDSAQQRNLVMKEIIDEKTMMEMMVENYYC